jgi:broad specificity phosphatase PhoE
MAPELIVCLRHGEKPVDADGKEISQELAARGHARAYMLADALRPGWLLPADASDAREIFVPDYTDGAQKHRCYQTMAPLGKRLGFKPTPRAKHPLARD